MGIAERITELEERIARACLRAGRKREAVRLLAVSKFAPREQVLAAWEAGLRAFGESRVQEAQTKFGAAREGFSGMELHFIGSLQRNKAKAAAAFFDWVESVDRDSLIDDLARYASSRPAPLSILFELNAGEAAKGGYRDEESLFRAAEKCAAITGIVPRGLMIMAPRAGGEAAARRAFRSLRRAQTELIKRFPGVDWSCLSMGMSGDFETAIEEGSTLIRAGTAIFGARP
ncbi:MAG: YggS family pyridoxal phosphate-dependent enzyme [Spirochaetaceae bacterium]|jgi:pyridoxal phosphate enzyme (YggS family)|nr:YggS family pyridoxal phosphate-dependent enzyme [Spirochaetaceae bacterium]